MMLSRHEMKRGVCDALLSTITLKDSVRGSQNLDIGDCLRAVLCCVQWESQERISSIRVAERTLERPRESYKG